MRRFFLINIVLFLSYSLYGQSSVTDRYYHDRITSCIELGKSLFQENEISSALEYYNEAIEIAKKRSHDYYAGFLILNDGVLEQVIQWYYKEGALNSAREYMADYETFYDATETYLKNTGDINNSDYSRYMRFCYSKLMLLAREYEDNEYEKKYKDKYVQQSDSHSLLNDEYIEYHKTYILNLLTNKKFDKAFNEAVNNYYNSKELGYTDEDAISIVRSVYNYAIAYDGLYWYLDDVSIQQKINEAWLSFITPLYESKGNTYMDQILMRLDSHNTIIEEVRNDMSSSTRLATLLTNCCLSFKSNGYDSAKAKLFELKNNTINDGYPEYWIPVCQSFFEFLQSIKQHAAVYSFCKLVEDDFKGIKDTFLDEYLTYYSYYFGACHTVGDIPKAFQILVERFEDEDIKNSPLYWLIARLKGSFYIQYLGNYEKGLASYKEALELYKLPENPQTGDYIIYSGLYGYVGDALRKVGNIEEAINYYEKDLEICEKQSLNEQKYTPLFYLGRIYHSLKDYDKSRSYFNLCADIMSQSIDKYQVSAPYSYLFDIERLAGNDSKAREYLMTMWESTLNEYLSFKDYLSIYELTSYWTKQGAIDYIGGLITESAPLYNDIYYDMLLASKGLLQKEEKREYSNVMSSNDEKLISLYNSIHSNSSVPISDVDEYMTLYRSYHFPSELHTPSWKEVQGALNKEDAAIEFFKYRCDDDEIWDDYHYGALILTLGVDSPKFIHLCSEKDLRKAINAGPKMYQIKNLLYDLIWAPLEKEIKGVKNIFFSPSELLHTINLSAIEDSKGRPLLESYNFSRLSSTYGICESSIDSFNSSYVYGGLIYDTDDETMVAEHRKYSNTISDIEWVSDTTILRGGWEYLPNTEREVEDIVRLLTKSNINVTEFTGTGGTEESFKSLNGKHPGHIHLATHGFYLTYAPADSTAILSDTSKRLSSSNNALTRTGLILSNGGRAWKGESIPDGVDDGILQADEIARIDLSGTSLLVLSACQTALGDVSSDGIYGLQRAFKVAGVETIIMSLWEIDDKATSQFMSLFYQALSKGRTKHEAFKDAQRALRKYYDDPYYWAAFIMLD